MLPSIFGENLFDDFFTDPFGMMVMPQRHDPLYGKHSKNLMKTDVRETADSYELDIDLPGFKKEDIHVDIADDRLTVSAERHSNYEDKDKKGNYLRCERSYGSYARSFDISGIDATGIKAAYADGVLRVTLPKQKEVPASSRRLEIE